MNFTQLREDSLLFTHTNPDDYSESQSVKDVNLVYQDMVDRVVVETKGDYFWDSGLSDTVVYQSEYVVEKLGIAPDDLDIKKINKVFVKYKSTDQYKTQLKYRSPGTLEYHPDWYKTNQPTSEAFFYIQDTSIFIYPAPDEAITGGLEIYVTHKPAAITTSTTEDEIEIPSQFHNIIVDGLRVRIYKSQGKLNEAQLAKQEYEDGIYKMIQFMKQRYKGPRKKTITGLDQYR